MESTNAITAQSGSTPVFLIDAEGTDSAATAAWVIELRAVGLAASALAWPRFRRGRATGPVTARDIRRFERAIGVATHPIVIGKALGGVAAYRLLGRDTARAAILIDSDITTEPSVGAHGPLLLIERAGTQAVDAETLRATGICDQHTTQGGRDEPAHTERDSHLALYISGWLDFHQLITR